MLFRRNVGWRYAFAAVAAIFSLACHAQSTLTPAQVLNFRRIADLHFSPDGAKLAYVEAFISNRDGKPQVYVMATDESAAVAVTAVKYGVSRFHWLLPPCPAASL